MLAQVLSDAYPSDIIQDRRSRILGPWMEKLTLREAVICTRRLELESLGDGGLTQELVCQNKSGLLL